MTSSGIRQAFAAAEGGRRLTSFEAMALAEYDDLATLAALAEQLCLAGHGTHVSFSKKVFIPLTKLCRDVCHYCTFAHAPRETEPNYLPAEAVLDIARKGQAAGCKEALFTLGDQPELRYSAAREALRALGASSTLEYLERSAALVLKETRLLPHLNPGVMDEAWLARLRKVSVSQGIMLETASDRLSRRGGPHFGSPDKAPAVRLATLEAAGRARVPFTTGILIGIGETRGRAHRGAAGHPRPARAAQAHPGGDRPELPCQARHPHERRGRAHAGRPRLDHRGGASRAGTGHEHPGRHPTCSPTGSRNWSAPASTTGAACRP